MSVFIGGGKTCFFLACERGDLDMVELLRDREGLDVGITDKKGRTFAFAACYAGHLNIVENLFEKYRTVFSTKVTVAGKDTSCLLIACQTGNFQVLKYLAGKLDESFYKIQNNPDFIKADNECLEIASVKKRYDIVKCLIGLSSYQNTLK